MLLKAFKDKLKIRNTYCWTDSQTALHWLFSNKQLPLFVQNRVDEIRKSLPNTTWNYVPTKENPCDLASRGTSSKYIYSDIWIHGPTWILTPSLWPEWPENPRLTYNPSLTISCTTTAITNKTKTDPIIPFTHYSSLTHLLRVTCLVIRFVRNLQAKLQGKSLHKTSLSPDIVSHNLTRQELDSAELFWVRWVQEDTFSAEKSSLETGKSPTNLVKQLNLFLSDGLLRCDRRLKNSFLNPDTKYPILLPHNHHFTKLLIKHYHFFYHHVGVSNLISLVRRKYYFSRMRQTIKKVTRPCILCKRLLPFRTAKEMAKEKIKLISKNDHYPQVE